MIFPLFFVIITGEANKGKGLHMKFKNIKIKNLLTCLTIGAIYPIIAYRSAETNPRLALINALFIVGAVYIVIGLLYSFILHGDLDITEFFVTSRYRSRFSGETQSFEDFKRDKQNKREGNFNYPLLVGILMFAASVILTLIYY